MSTTNQGTGANVLHGVAVSPAGDAWAAGDYLTGGNLRQTLLLHWDGTSWTLVPSPNAGSGANTLQAVAAVAANDAWAAGSSVDAGGLHHTLIEHWNGTAWTIVPTPDGAHTTTTCSAWPPSGENDVWAVGASTTAAGAYQTLTEHWNGSAWTVVPSPNVAGAGNLLYRVSAAATGDVWAVGYLGTGPGVYAPLALHWDGSTCTNGRRRPPARGSSTGSARSRRTTSGRRGGPSIRPATTTHCWSTGTARPGAPCPAPTPAARATCLAWPPSRAATSGRRAPTRAPPAPTRR